MRVLVAARLSQLADGQTGLDSQDAESKAWAVGNGHVVVDVVMDRKSGTSPIWSRKNLRPWVTDPSKIAEYDAVLAYRFDRLSRGDDEETSNIEAWARVNGKKLLTVDGLVYPCEGVDGIRWDVTKRIAHDEWLKISERYRRMQRYLTGEGKLVGKPPFGYAVVDADGGHKTIVPTDEGRTYVPQIFARVIAGESLAAIGAWLDSEGVTSAQGHQWWARTLGQIIRNPTYMGYRADAEGRTILRCEALVDAATFRRAGDALAGRPKRGPADAENRAMLAGAIFCSRCEDSPMYRIITGKAGNKIAYYRCTGRGSQRKGCGNMVRLDFADKTVDDDMCSALADEPVTIQRLVPGHDHSAELAELRFAMRQLSLRDLPWDQEDAERSRLRTEYDRIAALPSVPDRVEKIPTGRTMGQEWEACPPAERASWLKRNGLRVVADKAHLEVIPA
jgi:DNA invertase Pin-like site-specific DNA recombinase